MTNITSAWLKLTLVSDTTFGRGDGVAGLVDTEVQYNEYGLPYLNGKTLKGLLGAECAEILFALEKSGAANLAIWKEAGKFLFGEPGSLVDATARMKVSHAQLPNDLQAMIAADFKELANSYPDEATRKRQWSLKRTENLEALTALRRQTAMDAKTGAPLRNSLRTMRVILRDTCFVAQLDFDPPLKDYPKWLLAACAKSFRRAGTGRHRGRGRLKVKLYDQSPFDFDSDEVVKPVNWFAEFEEQIRL